MRQTHVCGKQCGGRAVFFGGAGWHCHPAPQGPAHAGRAGSQVILRGAGKVFSFTLLDAANGEIRACAFNDACERFFPEVQVGAVILLSKASLKPKRDNKVRGALHCAYLLRAALGQ